MSGRPGKHRQPVLTGCPLLTKSGNYLLTEPSEDMADHYGDAELIYGGFRNRLPASVRDSVHAATKWCVFGPASQPVSTQYVLQAVQERSRRLGGRVELLQFHWHDVSGNGLCHRRSCIECHMMSRLTLCAVRLARVPGCTRRACEDHTYSSGTRLCHRAMQLRCPAHGNRLQAPHTKDRNSGDCLQPSPGTRPELRSQGPCLTRDSQFSLIDSRPLRRMSAVCEKYGIRLLTYGCFVSLRSHMQDDPGHHPSALGPSSVANSEPFQVRRLYIARMA